MAANRRGSKSEGGPRCRRAVYGRVRIDIVAGADIVREIDRGRHASRLNHYGVARNRKLRGFSVPGFLLFERAYVVQSLPAAVAVLGPADAALIEGRGVRVAGCIDRRAAVLQGERLSAATVEGQLTQFEDPSLCGRFRSERSRSGRC